MVRPLAAGMGHGEWRATHLVVVKVRGAARREVVADGPSQVRDESRDAGHLTGENDFVRLPAEQPPLGLFGPAPVEVHGAQLRSRGCRRVLLDVDADQRDLLLVAVGDVDARRPARRPSCPQPAPSSKTVQPPTKLRPFRQSIRCSTSAQTVSHPPIDQPRHVWRMRRRPALRTLAGSR